MQRVTVFTPTFNRKDDIKKLFQSLWKQSSKDFVWLVIDDGSTDQTNEEVEKFKLEADFPIEYIWQENKGKYTALKLAIQLCQTDIFLCIDSDDIILDNCIERIIFHWNSNCDPTIIAFVAPRCTEGQFGSVKNFPHKTRKEPFSVISRYRCETIIAFKTGLLQALEFPTFSGERFVGEGIIYYQIASEYYFKTIYECLCKMEYKDDGLTHNVVRHWINNPMGTSELWRRKYSINYGLTVTEIMIKKIKVIIMQNCLAICRKEKLTTYSSNKVLAYFLLMPTMVVYAIKFRKFIRTMH